MLNIDLNMMLACQYNHRMCVHNGFLLQKVPRDEARAEVDVDEVDVDTETVREGEELATVRADDDGDDVADDDGSGRAASDECLVDDNDGGAFFTAIAVICDGNGTVFGAGRG